MKQCFLSLLYESNIINNHSLHFESIDILQHSRLYVISAVKDIYEVHYHLHQMKIFYVFVNLIKFHFVFSEVRMHNIKLERVNVLQCMILHVLMSTTSNTLGIRVLSLKG